MGTAQVAVWTLLFVVFQASVLLAAEETSCVPGFKSDLLIFKVSRKHLVQSSQLGKVGFTDCTDRTRFLFNTDDSHFMVQTDGTLIVKRPVTLHEGHKDFYVHSWDSQGQKMTVPVRLLHHHGNHNQNTEHHYEVHDHNQQLSPTEANPEGTADPQVPILHFPKSGGGLVRRKRAWIIPPLNFPENFRGPYPAKMAQIRSDKPGKIIYSITGPGADHPPVYLFTLNKDSGYLYVTEKLDREKQDKYIFQAHAVVEGGDKEAPMDLVVYVIDQNDNKPIFTQSTYMASVPESSPMGFEILKVNATDADEPSSDNSDVRYRIMGQDPVLPSGNMFAINSVTGAIRVNSRQLNRERFPQYTLDLQASDLGGEGLTGNTKVIIKVTNKNDVTPNFTQSNHTCTTKTNSSKDDSPPDLTVEEHGQRLSLLELASQNVSQRIKVVEEAVSNLQNANSKLSAKVLNLEGHSCRKNLRLLGLTESTETGDLTDFFASALSEIFGGDILPSPLELDRAHRTSSPVPKPGDLPRPVILQFHKFKTKELIIREARQKGILHYRDQQIQIIEDYCPEVLNQWADYKEVMLELYNRGLMPSLEFPSRLRITLKGKKKLLRSIEEAWWFVDNHSATQPSQ